MSLREYLAELSDDVLFELGPLVWAAMNLEDVVHPVCRAVSTSRRAL